MNDMDELNKKWDDLDAQAILDYSKNKKQIAADREHRDRRERIATAALQGLLAYYGQHDSASDCVEDAVAYADALIAELDKPKEGGT